MKHFLWTAQQRVVAGRVLGNIISRLLQMTPPQEQTMRNRTQFLFPLQGYNMRICSIKV